MCGGVRGLGPGLRRTMFQVSGFRVRRVLEGLGGCSVSFRLGLLELRQRLHSLGELSVNPVL